MSAAYRRPDASGVVSALRMRRLVELGAVEVAHGVAMDVYARRARRAVFGAVLLAAATVLALKLLIDPVAPRGVILGGWVAALALGAMTRDLAPLRLHDLLARRFLDERDVVTLEAETAAEAVTAAARGLERLSIALPLAGVMLLFPATLLSFSGLALDRLEVVFGPVQLALAALAWRFAGRLAQRSNASEIWRDGWAAVLWCGGVALVSTVMLRGPGLALFVAVAALFGATLFVPWLHELAVTLVERERDRLGCDKLRAPCAPSS